MRRALAVLACSVFPAVAAGDRGPPSHVIGGSDVPAGKWPDVAGILYPDPEGADPSIDEALCTGVLVAPTIVLTAAHCYDALVPPLPDNVLIGAHTLAHPEDGETIAIKDGFVFPEADTTADIAVLVLDHAATRAPRAIVDGWARGGVVNGAAVQIVGYGAIDENGDNFIDELQEATSTITDADCSTSAGCRAILKPAGELGAGGMGIDACRGDSGGPLYLMAADGPLLVGITSRSYDNPQVMCSEGSIYVRPDRLLDWIEMVAGVPVERTAHPTAEPITATRGGTGETQIEPNDPIGTSHRYEIAKQPRQGGARVSDDGTVEICSDADAPDDDDQVTVTVTDARDSKRAASVTVQIRLQHGDPAMKCDAKAFAATGGGCCDAGGRSGAAIPLALGVLALVRRRRAARSR